MVKSYGTMIDVTANGITDDFQPLVPRQHYVRIGTIRILNPYNLERSTLLFLGFGLASIIGAVVLTAVTIQKFSVDKAQPDFIFGILLIVNLCFVLFYVFHGVFRERPFEILISVAAVIIVLIYCIVDYASYKKKRTTLKLIRLVLICVIGPVDIGLGITVAVNFFEGGQLMIRLVGANVQLQSMCKTFFMFTAFLAFDFEIVISLLIMRLAVEVGSHSLSEKIIIGIGVPFSFAWVIIGQLAARYENKILAYIFLALSITEPVYIVYLFESVSQPLEKARSNHKNNQLVLPIGIIATGILGILARIALVVLMYVVLRNFGNQLKERLFEEEET